MFSISGQQVDLSEYSEYCVFITVSMSMLISSDICSTGAAGEVYTVRTRAQVSRAMSGRRLPAPRNCTAAAGSRQADGAV